MGSNLSDDDIKAWFARVYSSRSEEIVDMIFAAREREKGQRLALSGEMLKALKLQLTQSEANKKRPKDVAMNEAHKYWRDCREGRVRGLKVGESNFVKKFVTTVQTKWPKLTSERVLRTKIMEWEKEFSSTPFIPKIERPIAGPLNDDAERMRLLALDKRQLLKELSDTLATTGRHRQNRKPYNEKNDSVRDARSLGGTRRAARWTPAKEHAKQLFDERESGKHPELYPDSRLVDRVREKYSYVSFSTVKSWLTKLRKVQ